MSGAVPLDDDWLASHPLPSITGKTDKNGRGRVLLVGGARFVPGALALTGEAVLRAGAGKLQLATVEAVALALGVLVPEAAMVALPMREDGEIAAEAADTLADLVPRCNLLLIGPGMSANSETQEAVERLVALVPPALLLDAAALTCSSIDRLKALLANNPLILTPHHGEMARLADVEEETIARDPAAIVADVAMRAGATIILKGPDTWIADETGCCVYFEGGCAGLATGGSGDVLAGIIGGLVARGADPLTAAGWAVQAHGRAGRDAAVAIGPLGFLARDLLPRIPSHLAMERPGLARVTTS